MSDSTQRQLTSNTEMWGKSCSAVHKIAFTWTIENFSSYFVANQDDFPHLISPKFSPLNLNKRFRFYLRFYPKGKKEENKDFVSIFLHYTSSEEFRTHFSISVLKNNGHKSNTIAYNVRYTSSAPGWGHPQYLKRVDVLNKALGLLTNDNLTILCEVTVFVDEFNETGTNSTEDFERAIKQAEEQLSLDYSKLLNSGNDGDVVLRVGGKNFKDFTAHKIILRNRSPVFMAMFGHDLAEKQNNRVDIVDVNVDVFESLLRFIYTGKVDKCKLTADLLIASDKYQLDSLKYLCEQALCQSLDVASVAKTLMLADMHSADKLKTSCIEFINHHSAEVVTTEGWTLLSNSRPELVVHLYQDSVAKFNTSTPKKSA